MAPPPPSPAAIPIFTILVIYFCPFSFMPPLPQKKSLILICKHWSNFNFNQLFQTPWPMCKIWIYIAFYWLHNLFQIYLAIVCCIRFLFLASFNLSVYPHFNYSLFTSIVFVSQKLRSRIGFSLLWHNVYLYGTNRTNRIQVAIDWNGSCT